MKTPHFRLALALTVFGSACAAPLAMLPPSDHYVLVNEPPPPLSSAEQAFVDQINKEFARLGLPAATVGQVEMNAAAVIANVALAKIWNGSGHTFGTGADVAQKANTTSEVTGTHFAGASKFNTISDEEDDTSLKHMHTGQHLISRGIPNVFRSTSFDVTHAQTKLGDEEIQKGVRVIRPDDLQGKVLLGVAVLPVGDADKRVFVMVSRNLIADIVQGPPRIAEPGSTFEVAGTVAIPELKEMKWALEGPDGKVTLGAVPVDRDGHFKISAVLSKDPGRSLFSVREVFTAPIFAGVPLTPYPISAPPKVDPVDGTRTLATRLVKAITDWRKAHGLSVPTFDADLSAFAKADAMLNAKAADEASGANSGTPRDVVEKTFKDRATAAGYTNLAHWSAVEADDYVNDFLARLPNGPFQAAALGSPTLAAIGIGVALAPNTVTKDEDLIRYGITWVIKDPSPPKAAEGQ